MKIKAFYEYAEILRVADQDDGSVLAEGYAFVNEVVPGEGGIRLKRKAMEAATADYEQWGTIRSMHQPVAAGLLESVRWDEKGAYIVVRVIDQNEIKKVKAGVYKGFSVGVRARVMRGKDVETAEWIETSLVDRPKDPDALLCAYRADDLDGEYEVEVLDDEADVTRAEEFEAQDEPVMEQDEEVLRAVEAMKMAESVDDVPPVPDAVEADLSRVESLESELTLARSQAEDLIQRLSNTEADLSRVQGLLTAAEEEVKRLRATPTGPMPVRYPAAMERTFAINRANENPETAKLTAELAELERTLPTVRDEAERQKGVVRMSLIKSQLFGRG